MHLGRAKLVRCNQIPSHVADQYYLAFIVFDEKSRLGLKENYA